MTKPNQIPGELEIFSFEDLDVNTISPRLVNLYYDIKDGISATKDERLKEIHICGSYARGEAIEVASDLDVRYVLDNVDGSSEQDIKEFRDKCKKVWMDKYREQSDCFIHIDVWFGTIAPEQESVRIV